MSWSPRSTALRILERTYALISTGSLWTLGIMVWTLTTSTRNMGMTDPYFLADSDLSRLSGSKLLHFSLGISRACLPAQRGWNGFCSGICRLEIGLRSIFMELRRALYEFVDRLKQLFNLTDASLCFNLLQLDVFFYH